jgi:hypothetical protein
MCVDVCEARAQSKPRTTVASSKVQSHACAHAGPASSYFFPCCIPKTARWSNLAIRFDKDFRGNLLSMLSPKVQTLRPAWCKKTLHMHQKAYEAKQWIRVLCGGQGNAKTIGWLLYSSIDMVRLSDLTRDDCSREGRPEQPVDLFRSQWLYSDRITTNTISPRLIFTVRACVCTQQMPEQDALENVTGAH